MVLKEEGQAGGLGKKVPKSPFFRPSEEKAALLTKRNVIMNNRHHAQRNQGNAEGGGGDSDSEQKSTILGCASNLINAIVGGGIVGLPFAFKMSGFWAGCFLVVFVGIMTDKSLRLLIETAKHVHVPSYETVAEAAYGKTGFWFVACSMFLMAYGAMLTYLMIVKDTFSAIIFGHGDNVMEDSGEDDELDGDDSSDGWTLKQKKRILLCVVSSLVMFPVSCQRDMADLAKTSRMNVAMQIIMTFVVVYLSIQRITSTDSTDEDFIQAAAATTTTTTTSLNDDFSSDGVEMDRPPPTNPYEVLTTSFVHPSTIFVGVGVLSFQYVCQHPCFIIAGSLRSPTKQRWSVVTRMAVTTAGVLALLMGVSGYLAYGEMTDGNILNNLPMIAAGAEETTSTTTKTTTKTNATLILSNIARGLLGTTMLFVYPLESFVARHALVVFLFKGRSAHEGDDTTVLDRRDRRIILTCALYLAALVPAVIFDELGDVLAVTGALAGSSLSYFAPGCIYLAIHGSRFLQLSTSFYGRKKVLGERSDGTMQSVPALPSTTKNGKDSETIPLYCESIRPEASTREDSSWFVAFSKTILFYSTGMPVWIYIASWGKQSLTTHVSDLALQSPHPIRIGNVRFARAKLLRGGTGAPEGTHTVVMLQRPLSQRGKTKNITATKVIDYDDEDDDQGPVETRLIRSDSLPLGSKAKRVSDGQIIAISGGSLPRSYVDTTDDDDDDGESDIKGYRSIKGGVTSKATISSSKIIQRQLDEDQYALEDDPQTVPPSVWDF
eukprot:CAMPEP_0113441098 /NCGR_PEP_ID=MMETSP0014_2-20120614/900_1 /TAXON_ID=2857 /ORGANISM="Nitzschia sp." /LENGTH=775 /DNA_ID=CAMNT_0000331917 /DNA_START=119 /DNA_END=2443 /DNA_ORIENTATION=+ /assembly_acc=CAM_ASM_000159